MKPKMQLIVTCTALVIAAGLALWGYESSKTLISVANTDEAIIRARNYARSHFELKTENPCLVHPDGIVNIDGQTMDQWRVCFPIDERNAASYQVYSNGRVFRSQWDLDMYLAAQEYSSTKDGFLINWPASVKEKIKMVEEARKQGSKCTYY